MTCESCGQPYAIGDWPFCPHGQPGPYWTGDAERHPSERSVIYVPPDGNLANAHVPAVAQRNMHPKLAARGYQRVELGRDAQKDYCKQTGKVHFESENDSSTVRADCEVKAKPTAE